MNQKHYSVTQLLNAKYKPVNYSEEYLHIKQVNG